MLAMLWVKFGLTCCELLTGPAPKVATLLLLLLAFLLLLLLGKLNFLHVHWAFVFLWCIAYLQNLTWE